MASNILWCHPSFKPQAAYKDNTVGLARFTPIDNISSITRNDILSYLRTYHRPERTVLAGVGIEHEALVELAQKYFVPKTPSWMGGDEVGVADVKADASIAQYTGGIVKVRLVYGWIYGIKMITCENQYKPYLFL